MADYIDREKAEKIIQSITIVDVTSAAYAEAVLFIIRNIPSADVAPVVHGRWIDPHWRNSNSCANCSVCGGEAYHHDFMGVQKYYKFCPKCGAKMDEEKEEPTE